jgi:magnesium transporter
VTDRCATTRVYVFRAEQTRADSTLDEWKTLCGEETATCWVDVEAPDDATLARLGEQFGLDPRALALARRREREPTVRFYPEQYLVTALAVDVDEEQERPRTRVVAIDALVGRNFVVTLRDGPLPFAEQLQERTATNPQIGRFDAAYLLYVLLDSLIDHYVQEIGEIEDEVARLEERLVREPGRRAFDRALVVKRHVERVRRLISPHREAFGGLVGADSPIEAENGEAYFRDLTMRIGGIVDRLNQLRDQVVSSFNLYTSNQTHRTNQQLRVLTFLSAVLLPVTALTGMFGTNFKLAAYDAWEPFYVLLAGMGIIATGMLVFFRRKGWL